MNYDTFNAKLTGRNNQSRKLANHTVLHRIDDSTIAIKLHSTDVTTYHSDGRIVFDSGGWKTSTTKERMNSFSPARISQSRGSWTISIDTVSANFADGITWTGKRWTNTGDDPSKAVKLAKRAAKFARDYMSAFNASKIPAPSNGDCWDCFMKTADGKTPLGGADHILNHMKEKYYVPSLLQRAIERFPVAPVAMWYISDKWAGTNNNVMVEVARAYLYKSLYRYCKAELGLAS